MRQQNPARTTIALTVAGSDSGGGAGIQGDLKTFTRWSVFGTSVITAITAQNTVGVVDWEPVSPSLVQAQLRAVLSDLPPGAMKTGMLGTTDVIRVVVDALTSDQRPPFIVVDPVMVTTSGDSLAEEEAITTLRDSLLPLATIITPNLDEASTLLGEQIVTEDDMRDAAHTLVARLGAGAALVKGGHASGDEIVDVLYDGDWTVMRHPRLASTSTHGTGCALSAAITAQLASGCSLRESVRCAVDYVTRAIQTAPVDVGAGHGPLNHMA